MSTHPEAAVGSTKTFVATDDRMVTRTAGIEVGLGKSEFPDPKSRMEFELGGWRPFEYNGRRLVKRRAVAQAHRRLYVNTTGE